MVAPASTSKELEEELARREIEFVAVSFVDNAGIARAKCVPAGRLATAAEAGLGSPRVLGVFQGDDRIAPAGDLSVPVGDLRLVPDLAALAGGVDGWGWAPGDQHDQEGQPWPLCPRAFLKRMVEQARARSLELEMAFEIEWYAESPDGEPVHIGPGYSLAAVAESGPYLAETSRRLAAHGVRVEQLHAEYSPGQLEISLGREDPLGAADRCVLARHVIRSARAATGFRASFSPLVREGMVGNGCHLHFSLWRGGTNLLGCDPADPLGITPDGRSFLAGVVRELPALVCLGCSSRVSFMRLGPTRWTGAFGCWGVENRETPLRFIPGSKAARPGAANAELKPIDASANPYLVAGALIAAGLRGLDDRAELPPEVTVDPATLADAERERLGLAPLPADLAAAAAALEHSATLRAALGEELHGAILAVRRGEAETTRPLSDDDLLAYYRWRY
jgi:glutamine synthetase